jgi:hypothetical protein
MSHVVEYTNGPQAPAVEQASLDASGVDEAVVLAQADFTAVAAKHPDGQVTGFRILDEAGRIVRPWRAEEQ